ncbi:MAG: sensor histidine kinase [Planctomycetota bacterium]
MLQIPTRKLVLTGVLALVVTVALIFLWNIAFAGYFLSPPVPMQGAGSDGPDGEGRPGFGFWVALAMGDVLLVTIAAAVVWMFISTLRQARDLRRHMTFIDSVTHELKSPLTSLRLCLDTMLTRRVPDDVRERFCRMMLVDVDRLQTFIEHVLEADRLHHNERHLQYEPVDPLKLIDAATQQIAQRYEVPAGTFQVTADPDPMPAVMIDAIALDVIMLNLLDNAVKYRGQHAPEVQIRVRLAAGRLQIEVQDNGIGIPAGQLRRIFQRFYRLPSSMGRRGTGLGLSVTDALTRRMGGRITVTSGGELRGATFEVNLPVTLALTEGARA